MSLTSTSSRPCSASMRSTRAATCAGSRWSTATAMPSPPASVTSSAVCSIVSGRSTSERRSRVLRPVAYTVAPATPNDTAMPRPAPRVAPATSATLPVSGPAIPVLPPDRPAADRTGPPGSERPLGGRGVARADADDHAVSALQAVGGVREQHLVATDDGADDRAVRRHVAERPAGERRVGTDGDVEDLEAVAVDHRDLPDPRVVGEADHLLGRDLARVDGHVDAPALVDRRRDRVVHESDRQR